MPEEPPEFVPTTPDGESFHEFLDWRFDPHENTVVGNEYPGKIILMFTQKMRQGEITILTSWRFLTSLTEL